MTSYALDMTWPDAVKCPPYKIIAKVDEGHGHEHDYWVVLGLEHGFIGIPVGEESKADMHRLPGLLWGDVQALGSAVEPGSDAKVDAAFEQIDVLYHGHNGTEHEGHVQRPQVQQHTHHRYPGGQERTVNPTTVSKAERFMNRAQRRAAGA